MNTVKIKLSIKYLLLFTFWLNILLNSCSHTNEKRQSKADKIEELVSLYSDYDGFNGAVLVAHEGKIIYKNGFGWANMEWKIPNKADTKFRIASVTKQFTAMLILQLVADGKLDLYKPISTYVPNYPKEQGNKVNIHQLLTHSSGTPNNYESDPKLNKFPDKHRPENLVKAFSDLPLEFNPGERFSYSNSGYIVLGYIIEKVTGKSYETVLKEKILDPLNMKNTGIEKHRPITMNRANGYFESFGEYYNANYIDMSSVYAAGAIYSTVEDLFLFNSALSNEKLLQKKYLDMMFSKHIVDSDGGYYGYGLELKDKHKGNTSETIETLGHSGSIDGFCALFTRIPNTNSAIIFLNNTKRAYLNTMTTAITGILNKKPYDFPKKPLAKFMAEIINDEGIDKGILFYKEHRNDNSYKKDEIDLIVEGYRLLHANNAKDAAKVFKLATEIFPDRDNPYDSYAEALRVLGKNDEAIKNYRKSLKLNPRNTNAINMSNELGVDGNVSNDIFKADSTWAKEIFTIPLHFARDIKLKGIEDARFPKRWTQVSSNEFWSYTFAWNVNLGKELTSEQIEDYLQKYYDGLTNDVNKEKDLVLPKSIAEIQKTSDTLFTGKISIYDTFITKKPLKLNVKISQSVCEEKNKSIIIFKISPKDFSNSIWKKLERIKLREDYCGN